MCKVVVRKWGELKSTYAAEVLKGKFPACGVKYTSKHGHGLVLAKYSAPIDIVKQKAKSAGLKADISHVFIIPSQIERAAGI
jgi:hypothetical protein